ncbi:hypothetical protein BUALT_Bualt12G0085800 [Buddleja alternifolia]|uniref:F-box associated beta-propeller type 1 domain-containing protein n=1 Tax=Buddleja alternifolia TaxID=168488 RepID=A0AAV6WWD3_9LAMI|nr:hypothetical protein BUALT_Bualt12G0085800 [Buddleja alternifolia]
MTWVLWNPLIQELYELPGYDCADLHLQASGLGYDCAHDDYKVVRIDEIHHNGSYVYKTLVYSLKFDSWKWIKDCPCGPRQFSQGVYLNGILYWMSTHFIIALDLSTEDYRQLSFPSVFSGPRVDLGIRNEFGRVGWMLGSKLQLLDTATGWMGDER